MALVAAPFISLFNGYVSLLQRYTLPTQMATGGFTSGLGDIIYQQGIEKRGWRNHEMYRLRRMMLWGSCIFAPCANRWHAFLNTIHVGGRWTTVLARGATDLTIFSPFATSLFYVSGGLMEGRPLTTQGDVQGIKERLQERLWPTVQKQWCVFGPAQAINLTVMPVYARPPFLNVVAIGWSTFLASAASKGGINPALETQATKELSQINRVAVEVME